MERQHGSQDSSTALRRADVIRNVGFACVGCELDWSTSHTFRLASFSELRLFESVEQNIDALESILDWMVPQGLRMFRIGSSFVPFASHAVMNVDWAARFGGRLAEIGARYAALGFRLSMHPGQYTILNSPNPKVVEAAVAELVYAARVLDLMGLDASHKIVIHIGGVYGSKQESTLRMLQAVDVLPREVRKRLTLEHDDRHYTLAEVVAISEQTGLPTIFDLHHHQLNRSEGLPELLERVGRTWDCVPKIHLSSQKPDARLGAHDHRIRYEDLAELCACLPFQADLMIEAKGKEVAAMEVLNWLRPAPNETAAAKKSTRRK